MSWIASRCLLAALVPAALGAQSTDTTKKASPGPLFTGTDAVLVVGFTGATIGMVQFDSRIANYLQTPHVQNIRLLRQIDRDFNGVNETSLFIAGVGMYGLGKLTGWHTETDIAFHATEALVISTLANQVFRGVLGRARPFLAGTDNPRDFKFFKGFSNLDYRSLPSIHASANYSVATVIVSEVHDRWPAATWFVAPPLYVLASLPATARLHENHHWASDILSGAFLGTFTGIKVVEFNHSHPKNAIDRFFLDAVVGPGTVGFAMKI